MNKLHGLILTLLFTLSVSAGAQAQEVEWTVDASHTRVGFVARHLGFAKVQGQFKKFDAKLKADAKSGKLSALEASADAASVSTDNDRRDADLRSEDFFAADKFAKLKLKLKAIQWDGSSFTATCDLTIRDVTKEVTFKGELLGAQAVDFGRGKHMRAAYEASAKINRKDFGLKYSGVAEGLSIVGDEVVIELALEMSYTAK
jgi:polyisoprenoid-binding protein YceI